MPPYFLHLIGSVTWEVVEIGEEVHPRQRPGLMGARPHTSWPCRP
jgi:hypothetical protein